MVGPSLAEPYRFGQRIEQVLAHRTRSAPQAVALQQGDEVVTYADLTARAQRVTSSLRARGIGPGDVVPLLLDRSCELVVVLLGVLTAGAAYIAMDVGWPRQRVDDVIESSGARLLVAPDGSPARGLPVVSPEALDAGGTTRHGTPLGTPLMEGTAGACVFYTSGSTGRPKGVLCPHRGIIRTTVDVPALPMDASTVFLQAAPLPWDAFALELWAPLLNGGRCVLVDPGVRVLEPDALRAAVSRGVNTLFLTSSLFGVLSDEAPELFDALRMVMVGGERVSPAPVRRVLRRRPRLRVVHCYGPAESTIFTTAHPVRERDLAEGTEDLPLGPPVPRTGVVLLDEAGAVTAGAGEIAISGDGLALEYLADPQETRRHFVHIEGVRYYRTGDLAVRDDEGGLRYRGRRDRQVKLHGVRIELGEIDAVLESHQGVAAAHTVLVEASPGRRLLGTAYALRKEASVDGEVLRNLAAQRLLPTMVPAVMVRLPGLPLGATGKTDDAAVRRMILALAASGGPDAADPHAQAAPDDLLALVSDALRLPGLGEGEDFVLAGATSLDVLRLCARLQSCTGVRMTMADLYRRRTVGQLRDLAVPSGPPSEEARRPPTTPTGGLPLTAAQRRFWMAEQLAPGAMDNMILRGYLVSGPLRAELLQAAWVDVVERHPALLSIYPVEDGTPVQQVLDRTHVPALVSVPVAAADADADPAVLAQLLSRPWWDEQLDLAATPPVRLRLARLGEDRHLLFLQAHHICFDGWSESVLLADLGAAYAAWSGGSGPGVALGWSPRLPADRAAAPAAGASTADLEYWRERLQPVLPPLLPLAGPAASAMSRREVEFVVPPERLARLGAVAGAHGGPLTAVLLAGVARALHRTFGAADVVVGGTTTGRATDADHAAVGYFVEPIPLRLTGLDASDHQLVGMVVEALLGALEHSGTPFDQVVRVLNPPRDRHPFFQIWVVLQRASAPTDLGSGTRLTPLRLRPGRTARELVVEAVPGPDGGWQTSVQWRADGIDDDTGSHLAAAIDQALAELADQATAEAATALQEGAPEWARE